MTERKTEFCECDEFLCNKLHIKVESGEVYRGDNHFLMIDLPNYDEKEAEEYREEILKIIRTRHSFTNVKDKT